MLTVADLIALKDKPKLSDVSLQLFVQFYDAHICNRTFTYETDDSDHQIISVTLVERHLTHLLGVHYMVPKRQTGKAGYDLMKNGSMTFETLKQSNKVQFKSKKDRLLFFPFIYQILTNPTVITFVKTDGLVQTRIDAEIILYNQTVGRYLHIALAKDAASNAYYPMSFYERTNDDHIKGQKQLNVIGFQMEP